jgi:hypothetical protein
VVAEPVTENSEPLFGLEKDQKSGQGLERLVLPKF